MPLQHSGTSRNCLVARLVPGAKETFNDPSGGFWDAAPVFENGEAEALCLGPLTQCSHWLFESGK